MPSRDLLRAVNTLTVKWLGHLEHEETVGNAVLWGALGDPDLEDLRRRLVARIAPEHRLEWRTILDAVLSEAERASLFEGHTERWPG